MTLYNEYKQALQNNVSRGHLYKTEIIDQQFNNFIPHPEEKEIAFQFTLTLSFEVIELNTVLSIIIKSFHRMDNCVVICYNSGTRNKLT